MRTFHETGLPCDTSEVTNASPHERLTVSRDDGVELVGLRTTIKVWFDRPCSDFATDFLDAFELLLGPIKSTLNWYRNYNMTRFSPISARTWGAPKTWLERTDLRAARALYLKEAFDSTSVGQRALCFSYHPKEAQNSGSNTPYLRRATPASDLAHDVEGYVKLAVRLCERLPVLCGHIGYGLEVSWNYPSEAQAAAYALGMRYIGLVIDSRHATWPLQKHHGIETVSWLTLVGAEPLARLGGIEVLRDRLVDSPSVEVLEAGGGVVIRAGTMPALGDVNYGEFLPEYRAVYRALRQEIEPITLEFRPFLLDTDDDDARTIRWLRRFENP